MLLRQAFAQALRLFRSRKGISQLGLAAELDASYISRLESAENSATLEVSESLAQSMQIQPLSLLVIAYAIRHNTTPSKVLEQVSDELGHYAFLNENVAADIPAAIPHPTTTRAVKTNKAVQLLKNRGFSRAQIAQELGVSLTTVNRYWNKSA